MSLRANSAKKFACPYPIIECAQCSEQLFVPDWSEYVDERRVRHLWKCEACGYAFETTVSYAAESALA